MFLKSPQKHEKRAEEVLLLPRKVDMPLDKKTAIGFIALLTTVNMGLHLKNFR